MNHDGTTIRRVSSQRFFSADGGGKIKVAGGYWLSA
jgi:hypothetical protein